MNVQELYYILKKTNIDVNKFIEVIEFCSINEGINIMLERNLDMLDNGEGQIINRIYNAEVFGEMFVVIEKENEIFVYSCLDKAEMNVIKKMFNGDKEVKNVVVIERGKILAGLHKKFAPKNIVIKESGIKERF